MHKLFNKQTLVARETLVDQCPYEKFIVMQDKLIFN